MSGKSDNWPNSPKSAPTPYPRRDDTIKLAAGLSAGRSMLGISQVTFAHDMGISTSKWARAKTAAESISRGDSEYALNMFRCAGVVIDLNIEGDLRVTVPDDKLHLIAAAMSADVATDNVIEDTAPEHRP